MKTKLIIFCCFLSIVSCSKDILDYRVIDSNVSDTKSKTFVRLDVVLKNPKNYNENQVKDLLNHLYDSIMNTEDYKYHNSPNSSNIFIYETEEHFQSGMGQWIGKISKSKNEDSPNLKTQFIKTEDSNKEVVENDNLTGISEEKQREIWKKLILAEDKANEKAEEKYPTKISDQELEDLSQIEKFKQRAQENSEKNYEYQKELYEQYKSEIIKEYDINPNTLKAISSKGLTQNWPFPN